MPKIDKSLKKREKYTKKYFKRFSGRAQTTFEDILKADYQNAVKRAEALLSVSKADYPNVAPFVITIPEGFHFSDKVKYRLDISADGTQTLLYDQSQVTTIFFGETTVFYHRSNINHKTGEIAYDVAGEFSYFDIVYVETAFKFDNEDRPKHLYLTLDLSLADGTQVNLKLRNERLEFASPSEELITEKEQFVLRTFKERIRKSKDL